MSEEAAAATADGTKVEQMFSTDENKQFEHIKEDVNNFTYYEKQFQEVIMSLENDEVLESFRAEYAGLHHSFLKSHEGENRLLKKCVELQTDIYTCISKAQTAQELTEADKTTIEKLRAEIERCTKKKNQTKERESALKEKIGKLKGELVDLQRESTEPVEAAAQEAALNNLLRVRATVLKEKETQEQQMQSLHGEIAAIERRLLRMRESKVSNDTELKAIQDATAAKKEEVEAIQARKSAKEEELRVLRETIARRTALVATKQKKIDELREDDLSHGDDLRRTTEETNALTEEYQTLSRQILHTNTALQECNEDNDNFQRKVRDTMAEVQKAQASVAAAHKQYVKETKVLEALQRRNVVAEQKQLEAQQALDGMKEEYAQKEAELLQARQRAEATDRQLAAVHRERDMLHQDFMTAEQKTQRNASWLGEKESQLHHLQHELNAFEEYAQKQRESIYKATKECMKYEEETKKQAFSCANVLAEVQAREQQIAQAQRTVEDVEAKLKQQQAMLDTVESERNAYSKHYGQLRHELSEMNKDFQLTLNQIQQLKEELVRRDKSMNAEDSAIDSLQRQRKEVEAHISALKRRADKKKRSAEQFHAEVGKLSEVLVLANEETARQRRKCRDIMQERDVLYNRTTQRTKELTALYEKIHAQQGLLERGESAYRERVQHIEQLEYQEAQLSAELARLKDFISTLPDLRLLINNANRDLQKERVRVRALLDEGERKVNLHPAHELKWSDPETFELSERVRNLQREFNERRQLLDRREQDIEQKEQQYLKAKAAVAKQPGPEVAEQLSAYQANLVKKKGQVAQMQESLRYFREQTDLYRARHDELRDRLSEMARTYAEMREMEEKQATRSANSAKDNHSEEDAASDDDNFVYTGFVAPPLEP